MPTQYVGGTDMTIRSQEWLPIDGHGGQDERGAHSTFRPLSEHRNEN